MCSPTQFYLAMLKKMIPGFWTRKITLVLRSGAVIPVREFMTLYIFKEIFVDGCYDITLEGRAPLILDIGANTGLFALRMKQLFPQARITCYEPFPPNFEQLQDTIGVNLLQGVMPVRKAVGARAGSARLYIHKRNVGGHSLYASQASNSEYVDVEVLELNRIIDELAEPIDLLKADCEGAEWEMLMGLTHRQAQKVRQLIIEPTPRLYDVKKLIEHLNSLGYRHQWSNGLYLFSSHEAARV